MRLNSKTNIHRQTKHQSVTRLKLTVFILTSGGLMLGLLCPYTITDQSVSAESSTEIGSYTSMSSDSVISITAPERVEIDITPDFQNTTFSAESADISVTTNNLYGYTLSMGISEADNNTSTDLINSADANYSIPSIVNDSAQEDFPINSWGYTTDSTNPTYHPLTLFSSAAVIKETETPGVNDITTTTFAASTDGNIPSGEYRNTVTFSAVANPGSPTLDNPANRYMQDMTTELCDNTPTYEESNKTYSLIDKRDGHTYNVRKLKDGNCWMVSNLALTKTSAQIYQETKLNIILTSKDSDVSTNYVLPSSTPVGTTWGPTEIKDRIVEGDIGFAASNGAPWQSSYGHYYTWQAAVAESTSKTTTGNNAPSSICPKGWRLPLNEGDKSFDNLAQEYGVSSANDLGTSAISFDFAGVYMLNTGSLKGFGAEAAYWVAKKGSNTSTVDNAFNYNAYSSGTILSQREATSGYGFSIRCVAR